MDNDLQELEAELKRLRPVAGSRDLAGSIGRELATPPPRRVPLWAWLSMPLAAAAAVAGLVLLREPPAAPELNAAPLALVPAPVTAVPLTRPVVSAPATAAYKPVSAENLLYAQTDDGLVTLADGTTARRTRSSYVDTITWRNPRTQASLKWSVPRTEERVVPVSFQ